MTEEPALRLSAFDFNGLFSRLKASTKLIEQHLVKERDGVSKLKLARYLLHIPLR